MENGFQVKVLETIHTKIFGKCYACIFLNKWKQYAHCSAADRESGAHGTIFYLYGRENNIQECVTFQGTGDFVNELT